MPKSTIGLLSNYKRDEQTLATISLARTLGLQNHSVQYIALHTGKLRREFCYEWDRSVCYRKSASARYLQARLEQCDHVIWLDTDEQVWHAIKDLPIRQSLFFNMHQTDPINRKIAQQANWVLAASPEMQGRAKLFVRQGSVEYCPIEPNWPIRGRRSRYVEDRFRIMVPFLSHSSCFTLPRYLTILARILRRMPNVSCLFVTGDLDAPREKMLKRFLDAFALQTMHVPLTTLWDFKNLLLEVDWYWNTNTQEFLQFGAYAAANQHVPIIGFDIAPLNSWIHEGDSGVLLECDVTRSKYGAETAIVDKDRVTQQMLKILTTPELWESCSKYNGAVFEFKRRQFYSTLKAIL